MNLAYCTPLKINKLSKSIELHNKIDSEKDFKKSIAFKPNHLN